MLSERIRITDCYRPLSGEDVRAEILDGLLKPPRSIPSKYFYDGEGSRLFERITGLDEYYLTSTEKKIMQDAFPTVVEDIGSTDIIELGSGDCSKITILLDCIPDGLMAGTRYIPVDISRSAVMKSATTLLERYPDLQIHGLIADFQNDIQSIPDGSGRLFCFFGSTIGNLERIEAELFTKHLEHIMMPGDRLLLGLDMVKDTQVLERAYNDDSGHTAEFNRNMLKVVNRSLRSDFDPSRFDHSAYFNSGKNRVEMHLVASEHITVNSPFLSEPLILEKGESIHTENSYKYTMDDITALSSISGLQISNVFTDERKWFSLVEFTAE
ncbi:MAG: L-histidine N(alpha)-methyltransferase [Candidatus Aegiribacteria sp.]